MKKRGSDFCNEPALWDKFRTGSEEAFALIYEKFADTLYSYGCRLQTDKELVKDCIQDLFVNLWKSHRALGPTTSIKYYLFRSLRREIVLKVKQGKATVSESTSSEAEPSSEEMWINSESESHINRLLENALHALSERQREAIYLKFYQNLEFSEVASLMEITPRAVYKLIYRAIDILQKSCRPSTSSSAFPVLNIPYPGLQFGCIIAILILGDYTFLL